MGVSLYSKHTRDYSMGYLSFWRFRDSIAEYVPDEAKQGTVNFLEQSDCNGKLTYKECRQLLSDIQDMPDDDTLYGYLGRGDTECLTITKFKDMLANCIFYRCNLYWS